MERRIIFAILMMQLSIRISMADSQVCTTSDCTGTCSQAMCMQTCSVPNCRMSYSCSNVKDCMAVCGNGTCPKMSCTTTSGRCTLLCGGAGGCTNMVSRGEKGSYLDCVEGSCDMECTNYNSVCYAKCAKGNCKLKCKTKFCEVFCHGGNCTVIGGIGAKLIQLYSRGGNSSMTCATGNNCGTAGCDAYNNCVSYVKNPLNEVLSAAFPVHHVSIWIILAAVFSLAIAY